MEKAVFVPGFYGLVVDDAEGMPLAFVVFYEGVVVGVPGAVGAGVVGVEDVEEGAGYYGYVVSGLLGQGGVE